MASSKRDANAILDGFVRTLCNCFRNKIAAQTGAIACLSGGLMNYLALGMECFFCAAFFPGAGAFLSSRVSESAALKG